MANLKYKNIGQKMVPELETLEEALGHLETVFPEAISVKRKDHQNVIKLKNNISTPPKPKIERLKNVITQLKLQKEFVDVAAHELKAPLTIIKLSLENFKTGVLGPLSEKQKKVIERMEWNVIRLTRLTEDILSLARLENGRAKIRCLQQETAKFLKNVISHFEDWAERQHIRLELKIPKKLPLLCIDVDLMEQVLSNLMSNALRYAKTKIIVTVTANAHEMLISVHDDGEGIQEEHLPNLFQKFSALKESSQNAKHQSTGLGLAICKKIIEDIHGGKIWAESLKKMGAKFSFSLPLQCLCEK
ncbi:MAG: HAMP domain-containing histidine kinase [Deltaproteobacteria bacterium]|nr:HAMP domain-containing histidine kinase [Deltaproteobacteria bacterium]